MVRGREHWTLIPSFAGRRMAAGLPISLLPLPEYLATSELVQHAFRDHQMPDEASDLARRLRIDYLYVDSTTSPRIPMAYASSTSTRRSSRACSPAAMCAFTG